MKCTIRNIMLCSDCIKNLETIEQYNIWKYAIEKNTYITLNYDHDDYKYLERNGYILTTEEGQYACLIKPCKGMNMISEHGPVKFYCAKPGEHMEYLDE